MSNRIEIRGVIVDSSYDMEYLAKYIDRGIITPESHFRRALAAANVGQPVELYINSPGGSVFAGYEMLNAIREWRMLTGEPVNVTLGGMAASMGGYLAAMLGPVRVHANTKIMYHGASGFVWGGADAMQDEAKLLHDINSELKAVLSTRYGFSPDAVSTWFAEGRAGWITAQEAVDAGLASEIIDAQAVMPERGSFDGEHGLKIAACWEEIDGCTNGPVDSAKSDNDDNTNPEDGKMPARLKKILAALGLGPKDGETEEATEQRLASIAAAMELEDAEAEAESEEAEAEEAEEAETDAGEIGEADEAASEADADDDPQALAEMQAMAAQLNDLSAQIASLQTKLADADRRAQSAEDRLAQLLPDTDAPPIESADMTFAAALEKCDGDYAKAREKYPDAYAACRAKSR